MSILAHDAVIAPMFWPIAVKAMTLWHILWLQVACWWHQVCGVGMACLSKELIKHGLFYFLV